MAEPRAEGQFELIREMRALLVEAEIPFWLRGGWALDFLVGRITREHDDIDLFAWAADAERLSRVLQKHGYSDVGGPPRERQRNFEKAGEHVHVALLETDRAGDVFTATLHEIPWPQGMLGHPSGRIGDLAAPIISPEAQLWAKENLPRLLGDPPRRHDPSDIALLRDVFDG